ncbi:MAG: DUF952 domain-containing protein [Notoacmeibacter sp.]
MTMVYKILEASIWNDAVSKGVFEGATIDLTDGFIHLSTAVQAPVTASLFFKTGGDLMLVGFDDQKLAGLKYEPSRGGELFPHVYGSIDPQLAVSVFPLERQEDGSLKFPDDFQ